VAKCLNGSSWVFAVKVTTEDSQFVLLGVQIQSEKERSFYGFYYTTVDSRSSCRVSLLFNRPISLCLLWVNQVLQETFKDC